MRDSAVVYRNFMKAVKKLPVEKQGTAYEAYMLLALDGIEYDGDDYAIAALLESFSGKIDEDREKYEAKQNRTRAINEAKSGRNRDDIDTKSERNRDELASDIAIDIVDPTDLKETPPNGDAKKAPQTKRFVKPSLEEVAAYSLEMGYDIDAGAFMAYYDSNGWKVGRNPMRDWKAAVRSWHSRDKKNVRPPTKPKYAEFEQRKDDLDGGILGNLLEKLG